MAGIHGGKLAARALKQAGVECVFTLSGGHVMAIYDGCLDEGIRIIDVRHEQAAVHAADAWSRLNPGSIGCAVLTAGPGVTDGVTGVANAWRANSPILVIGGQGLHYYMRTRLAEFAKKDTAIAILIPGKLDWYSFLVTPAGEDKGLKKFVIKAQSAFLRLFAPKLEVWYAEDGKLMRYRGLSNLPDAKGGNQQVEIKYEY